MNYVGNSPAPEGLVLVGDTNPVGLIGWFHAVPDGSWLRLNGQSVAKVTYPDLWTHAQGFLTADQVVNPGLYRDLGATLALPNLDGLFVRSSGGTAAALGVKQAEMIGPHTHPPASGTNYVYWGPSGGALTEPAGGAILRVSPNTAANTGTENRPVNVALIPCVKALRTILVPSTTIPVPSVQLLADKTAANVASLDFTNLIGYAAYRFVFNNVVPATDNNALVWRASSDNGVNFDAGALYMTAASGVNAALAVVSNGGNTQTFGIISTGGTNVASYGGVSGEGVTNDLQSTAVNRRACFTTSCGFVSAAGNAVHMNGYGQWQGAVAMNAIRFLFAGGGNIASGRILCYGLRGA